jgi:hypothetical protein
MGQHISKSLLGLQNMAPNHDGLVGWWAILREERGSVGVLASVHELNHNRVFKVLNF